MNTLTPAEARHFDATTAPPFEVMSLLNSTADTIALAVGRFKTLTPLSTPSEITGVELN